MFPIVCTCYAYGHYHVTIIVSKSRTLTLHTLCNYIFVEVPVVGPVNVTDSIVLQFPPPIFLLQLVMGQLSSPPLDSYMADEADDVEGSGEGSGAGAGGSSRSGWDDDENADEYSSGDGSGENPITTQAPGTTDLKGNFRPNTACRVRLLIVMFLFPPNTGQPTDNSAPKSPGPDIVITSSEPTGAAPSLQHVPLLITVCLIPMTRIF